MASLIDRLHWGAERLGGKRALAVAAQISEAQLYRYLEGDVAIPHDKLIALAEAFGADPAWLLGGRGSWERPRNRPRPEFRGALLEEVQEHLDLLLIEYQRKFPPALRSRMVRYLYEGLRHEEVLNGTPMQLDRFKMLQYVSFLAEIQTEAEMDVLREAFEILEYNDLTPNYQGHHQLLTTWCNLLTRGLRGYYNSYAGQVYFERMGQNLPADTIAELHMLTEQAMKILKKSELDWLDAGCGNGRHLAHLHKFMPNFRIKGLELSDSGVELCKKLESSERLPIGCVQQGDMRLAPYKTGSFDVVFARMSLFSLPALNGLNIGFYETFEELKRLLRTKGLLIGIVPAGNNEFKIIERIQYFDNNFLENNLKGGKIVSISGQPHSSRAGHRSMPRSMGMRDPLKLFIWQKD